MESENICEWSFFFGTRLISHNISKANTGNYLRNSTTCTFYLIDKSSFTQNCLFIYYEKEDRYDYTHKCIYLYYKHVFQSMDKHAYFKFLEFIMEQFRYIWAIGIVNEMNINLARNHQIEPKDRFKMHRHIIHITNKQDKFRIKINSKVKKYKILESIHRFNLRSVNIKTKKFSSWKIVLHAQLSDSSCNFTW